MYFEVGLRSVARSCANEELNLVASEDDGEVVVTSGVNELLASMKRVFDCEKSVSCSATARPRPKVPKPTVMRSWILGVPEEG